MEGGTTLEKLQVIIDAYTKPYRDEMEKVKAKTAEATASVEKRTAKIGSAFKKVAATIGIALGIAAIVSFGKSCVELGSNLTEVQNVVDVAFGSMSGSVDSFAKNSMTQFGLSETAAKKYIGMYGTMAEQFGFTTQQAYNMSTELAGAAGDVASFYNITSDEAYTKLKSVFSGETETLKDIGVVMTQNALDAYALANGYGKVTSAMSEKEKVALRLQFVMSQLTSSQGDFARTSSSWANQTRVLSLQFQSLKATIGQGLINAFTPVLTVINSVMAKLQVFANYFSNFTAALFGKQNMGSSVASTLSDAAVSSGTLADNTASTADSAAAAQSSLMGFDEINKISDNNSSSNSTSGLIADNSASSVTVPSVVGLDSSITDNITKITDKLKNTFGPTVDALGHLWDALVPFASEVGVGLLGFLGGLKDIGMDALNGWIPSGINLLADALSKISPQTANDLGESLGKIATALIGFKIISKFAKQVGAFSDKLSLLGKSLKNMLTFNPELFVAISSDFLDSIWEAIEDMSPSWALNIFDVLGDALAGAVSGAVAGSWFPGAGTVVGAVLGAIVGAFSNLDGGKFWSDVGKDLFSWESTFWLFSEASDSFKKAFDGSEKNFLAIGGYILAGIAEGFVGAISFIFEPIADFFQTVYNLICSAFGIHSPATEMMPIGENILLGIKEGFVGAWNAFWNSIAEFGNNAKQKLGDAWNWAKDGITDFAVDFTVKLSTTVGSVRNFINDLIDAINDNVITKLDFSIDAPGWLGGGSFGWTAPRIPRLAKGGIVDSAQMFIAGEAGKEAIMPLENNTGWIDQLASRLAQKTGGANSNNPVSLTLPIYIGGEHFTTVVIDDINRITRSSGTCPIYV